MKELQARLMLGIASARAEGFHATAKALEEVLAEMFSEPSTKERLKEECFTDRTPYPSKVSAP